MESALKNTLKGVSSTFPEIAFGNFLDPPRGGVNNDASKGCTDKFLTFIVFMRKNIFEVIKGFALLNPPGALPLDLTGPSALDPTRAAALDPLGFFLLQGLCPCTPPGGSAPLDPPRDWF